MALRESEAIVLRTYPMREADLLGADLREARYTAKDLEGALHVP